MNSKDLVIDNRCLGEVLQLVDVVPNLYSADGKRLDTPNGYKYAICVRAFRNDKIVVSIPGDKLLDTPSTMTDVYVAIDGLVVRPYVDRTGRLALTATATGIHKVKRPSFSADSDVGK